MHPISQASVRPAVALTCLLLALAVSTGSALAGETRVAVAANFASAADRIGGLFHKATGHRAVFIFGSTGQLYAQIANGAPFDLFLAADQARPSRAVASGFAVQGSRFTYATGRLVLYSATKGTVTSPDILKTGAFQRVAIANPATAPYGAAAIQTMKALGVYGRLSSRLVRGNNIAQTFQFVKTGNVEIGFVALSQVAHTKDGSRWIVPQTLHAPVAQDAVLLKRGAENPAARAFVAFLKGAQARAVKLDFGYGAGE